jgi:hypothetical protein
MDGFPDLSVRVMTFDHQPVAEPQVTAQSAAGAVATATTDPGGRARLQRADASDLLVRVEAPGLEPQGRTVSGERPERVELFMLGPPGMPFYYRGTVRVPFEPINDAVGVLLRDPGADAAAGQPRRIEIGEVTARAQRLTEEPGTTLLRSEGTSPAATSRSSDYRKTASTATRTPWSDASRPAARSRMRAPWCSSPTSTHRSSPTR